MPASEAADHRLLSWSSMTSALAKAKRPDGPRLAAGMLVYLASLGLIGAVTVISFAIAAISSLYTGDEMQNRSSAVDQGEVNSIRPDLSSPTDGNVAPVKRDTTPSTADASAPMPSAPPQSPPPVQAPVPEAGPSQQASQPSSPSEPAMKPSPEAARSAAPPSPEAARSTTPPSPEAARSTTPPSPEAARSTAPPSPKAAPSTAPPTPPPPGEPPDQLFREFAIQRQHQQVAPVPGITMSNVKPAAPSMRDSQSYEYRVKTNTASRKSRIREECGPIKDPALQRDCIASFNLHYPAR
jgi:hypothetical protein